MTGATIASTAVDAAHRVLSHQRRRRIVENLDENGETASIDELVELVAATDRGHTDRASVATTLRHTHLPLMDDADVVAYDTTNNTVTLTDHGERVAALNRVTEVYLGGGRVEFP